MRLYVIIFLFSVLCLSKSYAQGHDNNCWDYYYNKKELIKGLIIDSVNYKTVMSNGYPLLHTSCLCKDSAMLKYFIDINPFKKR